jgi:hypothetical protein
VTFVKYLNIIRKKTIDKANVEEIKKRKKKGERG